MVKRLLIVSLLLGYLVTATVVHAEECDNPGGLSDTAVISGCISKYGGILDAIAKANVTNKGELDRLNSQITKLKSQISSLNTQLNKLEVEVFEREVKVGVKQGLLAAKVKQDYIRKRDQPVLLLLFSSRTASEFFRDLAYREKLARDDQEIILEVAGGVKTLHDQSPSLKNQKENLAAL